MDLRLRLVLRLGMAFGLLMVVFVLLWAHALREDAIEEQAAATRLVDLLLTTRDTSPEGPDAQALLQKPLRHVRAQLLPAGSQAPVRPSATDAGWLAALGMPDMAGAVRQLDWGDRVLRIEPDPHSELREKLLISGQMLVMLMLFGGLCLGMVWYAVHRALQPVRDIEVGLKALAMGRPLAPMAPMALRELDRIAHHITQLAQSLEQSHAQQQALTEALMQVQDQERRALAAELHDEFGQSLTAITATATYIERHAGHASAQTLAECAREIGESSRSIGRQVREMLARLRPYELDHADLGQVLQELISSWQTRLPNLKWSSEIGMLPLLPPAQSLALYRCLQEALTNCVRHSQATHIRIACHCHQTHIGLSVSDNGHGRADQVRQGKGSGLPGLRERLRQVGGTLQLQDAPEGGLVLHAHIPLPEKALP